MIVFETPQSGWYIHGKSSIPAADVSLADLRQHLQREATSEVGVRGLTPDAKDEDIRSCQTFRMFIGRGIAAKYEELVNFGNMTRRQQATSGYTGGLPSLYNGISVDDIFRQISYLFRRVIFDIVSGNSLHAVLEPPFIRRVFGLPPSVAESSCIFEYDFKTTFMEMTFYSHDMTIAMWECVVFVALDVALSSPALATAITLMCWYILRTIRMTLGTKRLSETSMIDKMFLI